MKGIAGGVRSMAEVITIATLVCLPSAFAKGFGNAPKIMAAR